MTTMNNPYPLPEKISPTLLRVISYWESLKRGNNNMPFWDDVNLSVLPDLTDRLLLIDVFVNPELSLSQTLSGWQLIENQAILLWDEGSLQTYWLDSRRSAPVAGNA